MLIASMSAWLIVANLILAAVASAQTSGGMTRSGPTLLASPIAGSPLTIVGSPLTADQVEERTRVLPNGTSSTEVVRSKIYRDRAGRIRVDWTMSIPGSKGKSLSVVYLINPVARSAFILLVQSKIAHREVLPSSGSEGLGVGFPAVAETLPGGKWQTRNETLGERNIDGVAAVGTRTTHISESQPPLLAGEDCWVSKNLGLTLLVEAYGPDWKNTARLENINRHEPDASLFAVPPDYTVQN